MSFRLPTNPDAFIPPPSEQLTLAKPWRGTFVYPQAQPSRNATLQEIFVAAAETEGDNRVDLWKRRLSLHVTRSQMASRDITVMMQRQSVPLCAFMPDRLADPNAHSANQKHFSTLSQMLSRNNLVAFAPFDTNNRRGPGVLIFSPLTPADSLLAGAILMTPDLLDTITSGGTPPQTGGTSPYQQATATHPAAYHQPHQAYGYPPSNAQYSRARSERGTNYFMEYDTQYQPL
ncbi:hypothetical protein BJ322DRAFT_1106440 [Thelephora terrestris]|uniref:Uncharacterized protein n=1 Tax=Thelephora terrestris TaxID=56493 RepID=A0A9P6L8X9_9AGAM|nr:hypothetical protein BJ322DRAFT_1106440 [Thelephora terrestris]